MKTGALQNKDVPGQREAAHHSTLNAPPRRVPRERRRDALQLRNPARQGGAAVTRLASCCCCEAAALMNSEWLIAVTATKAFRPRRQVARLQSANVCAVGFRSLMQSKLLAWLVEPIKLACKSLQHVSNPCAAVFPQRDGHGVLDECQRIQYIC